MDTNMHRAHYRFSILCLITILLLCACNRRSSSESPPATGMDNPVSIMTPFETELESLRVALSIPGMSAAIVRDGAIIWSKGFGEANPERHVAADAHTPYRLGVLTTIFSATLALQLVQEGQLKLTAPVLPFLIKNETLDFNDPLVAYLVTKDRLQLKPGQPITPVQRDSLKSSVQLYHVLSHSVDGKAGDDFVYNPIFYNYLDPILEAASGKSLAVLLQERLIDKLNLKETIIAPDDPMRSRLASPFTIDDSLRTIPSTASDSLTSAFGLISSVTDFAKFDIALQKNMLLNEKMMTRVLTPVMSKKKYVLPTSLGWFAQEISARQLVWNFNLSKTASGLIVKAPSNGLTFVLLANSPRLTAGFDLQAGDVLNSVFVYPFLRHYAMPLMYQQTAPTINWHAAITDIKREFSGVIDKPFADIYFRELLTYSHFCRMQGQVEHAQQLLNLYAELYAPAHPVNIMNEPLIAEINRVGKLENRSVDFSLAENTSLLLYAIGEGHEGEMFDFGWIENATTGKIVWKMAYDKTGHAGGTIKNRKAIDIFELPAGNYRLRYQTDDTHAFGAWNETPPDDMYRWGIAIYKAKKEE